MLKLNEDIHKVMISTPSRFVGSYLSEDISVQLSFSNQFRQYSITESPNSRTFLVVSFYLPHDGSVIRRNLTGFGDSICSILSLLYGKEFINHGMLESHGNYRTPNLALEPNEYYYLPQYNYKAREDIAIPLDLDYFKLIEPIILENEISTSFRQMISAAGKFYNRALSIYPKEPELAFLDLITSGEIISNFTEREYTDEQLYDENLLKNFGRIQSLERGDRIVRDLKSRLFQVKRKFFYSLIEELNDSFYEYTEAIHPAGRLSKDNIEQNIKSAYDLRSLYVHTGLEFGDYIDPQKGMFNEIAIGSVESPNRNADKALSNTLTFSGLERIIRYALLRLIHKNGIKIDSKLD
ncbi:hypothetical protein ACX163_25515 [Bacillus cereus]